MEKFNDALVLTMCYFLYLFTSLIPGQEDKYLIGWIYMCVVASLLMANLSVMVHGSLQDIAEKAKEKFALIKKWLADKRKAALPQEQPVIKEVDVILKPSKGPTFTITLTEKEKQ